MKKITVEYKDIEVIRFTVTPERVTIKAPLTIPPTIMERYKDFLLKVANEDAMLNCTKSFRGCLSLDTSKLYIKMYSDAKKEFFVFYDFEGE